MTSSRLPRDMLQNRAAPSDKTELDARARSLFADLIDGRVEFADAEELHNVWMIQRAAKQESSERASAAEQDALAAQRAERSSADLNSIRSEISSSIICGLISVKRNALIDTCRPFHVPLRGKINSAQQLASAAAGGALLREGNR